MALATLAIDSTAKSDALCAALVPIGGMEESYWRNVNTPTCVEPLTRTHPNPQAAAPDPHH
jgi:hypothetical protein